MPKGNVVLPLLLLAVFVAANACGAAPPPADRSDVQRGTALPPPGLNVSAATAPR